MLPFHASAHSHALSQSVPLTSDARAIKKKDCGAHTATAVHAAAGSSGKPGVRVCTMCGTSKTKQWRSGSDGKPSYVSWPLTSRLSCHTQALFRPDD
jgi:hypothetical protein